MQPAIHNLISVPLAATFLVCCLSTVSAQQINQAKDLQPIATPHVSKGISFRENLGQWNDGSLYRVYKPGANVAFFDQSISFCHTRTWTYNGVEEGPLLEHLVWNIVFENAINSDLLGEYKSTPNTNYIRRRNEMWKTYTPDDFSELTYTRLYNGIDLKYYGTGEGLLKYDFIVQPDADPSQIRFKLNGVKSVAVSRAGRLEIETEWGILEEEKPYSYQIIEGVVQEVEVAFKTFDENTVGFVVNGNYDSSIELIIDPIVLEWSTFVGSTLNSSDEDDGDGYLLDQAVDQQGNVYATGKYNANFPTTPGVYMPNKAFGNQYDAYAFKLSADGTTLLWSTYLGGERADDIGTGIDLGPNGGVYVSGWTRSDKFPVSANAFQATKSSAGSGTDFFVAKLSADGTTLDYSTYLGGVGSEQSEWSFTADTRTREGTFFGAPSKFPNSTFYQYPSIKVNGAGEAFIAGGSTSIDYPVQNPFQATRTGKTDVVVSKLNATGSALLFSTYLGGDENDEAIDLAIDGGDNVYITGYTESTNFPNAGGINGPSDAFVAKFSSTGNLIYNKLVGGSQDDQGMGMDVDATGAVYVTGWTKSLNFPTSANAYDKTHSASGQYKSFPDGPNFDQTDAIVFKLDPAGNNLVYSTFLGGSRGQAGEDLAVSAGLEVFVTGYTYSSDFPTTTCATQKTCRSCTEDTDTERKDLFTSILSVDGSSLIYSQFMGGSRSNTNELYDGEEYHSNVDFVYSNCLEEVVLSISTHSADFPSTPGSYQPNKGNLSHDQPNLFKLKPELDIDFTIEGPKKCGEQLTFTDLTVGSCIWEAGQWEPDTWLWDFGDGTVLTGEGPHDHEYTKGGTYEIKLMVGCPRDSIIKTIVVEEDVTFDIELGPDTSMCAPATYTIDPGTLPPGTNVSWSNGETTPIIQVTESGQYILEVDAGGRCKHSDTVEVTIEDPPVVALAFTPTCTGDPVTLDAGVDNATYEWTSGETTKEITVTNPGNYGVTASFGPGCDGSDDVDVTFKPAPAVSLSDTTLCGTDATLDAGPGPGTYLWNTGETTQTITVSTAGEYSVIVTDPTGECTADDTANVSFSADLQVNIPDADLCSGQDATLDAGIPDATYTWNTGETTQQITVDQAGTYDVQVSKDGCDGTGTVTIAVVTPTAQFNGTAGCRGAQSIFSDGSSTTGGTITKWEWDFGDENTSTDQNPSHIYLEDGTFDVQLIVTTSGGCKDTIAGPITLLPLPDAQFTPDEVCTGGTNSFVDGSSSDAGILSWAWNLGDDDNTTSTEQNPTHTYGAPGSYDAMLIVTDNNGCIDTAFGTALVTGSPTAGFVNSTGCELSELQFTDQSSIALGNITGWEWNFGDGTAPSTERDPRHAYSSPGTYTVTLVVTSAGGCTDTILRQVEIFQNPVIDFSASGSGCRPVQVEFTDNSDAGSSQIESWMWDFGDGNTSTEQNPTHTYEEEGTYDVKLIASTAARCADTLEVNALVEVYPLPTADFDVNPPQMSILDNAPFEFTDKSSGAISWTWDFGDNVGTSNEQDPTYLYTDVGTYYVTQVVVNEFGCPAEVTKPVELIPEWSFYVPNVFTPNGRGANEDFIGKGFGVIEHKMWIYDRWGIMIYKTDDTKTGSVIPWNGKVQNKYEDCQEDTYVYVVHIKDVFERNHKYVGHVSLVR